MNFIQPLKGRIFRSQGISLAHTLEDVEMHAWERSQAVPAEEVKVEVYAV